MAFGLCNTRATFKRLMRHLLDPLIQLYVIAYLDDICLYSKEPSGIGREALVGGTGVARGGCQILPYLLMLEDFGPSHHFSGIPTAGGAASAAAAQPRIVTTGEGRSYGSLR